MRPNELFRDFVNARSAAANWAVSNVMRKRLQSAKKKSADPGRKLGNCRGCWTLLNPRVG